MPTPTPPLLSNAEAATINDTLHAGTGSRILKHLAPDNADPGHYARLVSMQKHILDLLTGAVQGLVYPLTGRNVGVYPCKYMIGGTAKTFAGHDTVELAPSQATIHLYLDNDQVLYSANSAWPGTPHFKLAIVQTNATNVLSISDERFRNFQVGAANAWWTFLPQADVNFDSKWLRNLGGLQLLSNLGAPVALSGGIVAPAAGVVVQYISSVGDLFRITPDAGNVGRYLVLRSAGNDIRAVDKFHADALAWGGGTPNISLVDGDEFLIYSNRSLILHQVSATDYLEVGRCGGLTDITGGDWDRLANDIFNVGQLSLASAVKTIAAGAINTGGASHIIVANEGLAGTDDLDTLSGARAGSILFIQAQSSGSTTNVRHQGGGSGNIRTQNGKTMVLNGYPAGILIFYDGAFYWELARLPLKLSDLTVTGQVIPYPVGPFFISGTPAGSTILQEHYVLAPFKMIRAAGRAKTAPSGGSLVIRILKNGASVHANDAAAINISTGNNHDVCDDVSVDFAIGDIFAIQTGTVNSAADISVSVEARIDARS